MNLPMSNPNKTRIAVMVIAAWHALIAVGGAIGAFVMWQAQGDRPALVQSLELPPL